MNKQLKIGIQGVRGAFHEEAAYIAFNKGIEIVPCMQFEELCTLLAKRKLDGAVMAIENTIAGTILPNYELLRKYDLHQVGEVILPIQQHLIGWPNAKISQLRSVSSHHMALEQCRKFFDAFPQIELIESNDTALSVAEVASQNDTTKAAIGSRRAADFYGLTILSESIETNKANMTRFAVLSGTKSSVGNKLAITMVLHHVPGALHQLLEACAALDTNLTKIESVPILGEPFHYRFYIDLLMKSELDYDQLILALNNNTSEFKIMGRYPAKSN